MYIIYKLKKCNCHFFDSSFADLKELEDDPDKELCFRLVSLIVLCRTTLPEFGPFVFTGDRSDGCKLICLSNPLPKCESFWGFCL